MNNEEKILEMLAAMQSEIGTVRSEIGAVRSEMETQFAQLEASQKEMQETITRVAVTQENIVLPRLETLTDGHTHLVKTLATKEQAQKLAADVEIIKDVVKHHRIEINELKKAQ